MNTSINLGIKRLIVAIVCRTTAKHCKIVIKLIPFSSGKLCSCRSNISQRHHEKWYQFKFLWRLSTKPFNLFRFERCQKHCNTHLPENGTFVIYDILHNPSLQLRIYHIAKTLLSKTRLRLALRNQVHAGIILTQPNRRTQGKQNCRISPYLIWQTEGFWFNISNERIPFLKLSLKFIE